MTVYVYAWAQTLTDFFRPDCLAQGGEVKNTRVR